MSALRYVPLAEFHRVEKLPIDVPARTRLFATACRINALYMITRAGSGHIGSSFSSLDIVAWLILNELGAQDVYFSSKGHDVPGLYAVLIARGLLPFDKLHTLRRLGGLPGHPDVSVPYVPANTGSLGMGISKAKGMARALRLRGRSGHIYVLTGDGELQEGQFWESLPSAVNQGLTALTVIVDHNKIQSDTWVSRVSDLGDVEAKCRAFGWMVARCDGHDPRGLAEALTLRRTDSRRPAIIIADTMKGRGVSFMEQLGAGESLYRFHSGAPDNETYARALSELVGAADRLLEEAGATGLRLEAVEHTRSAPTDRTERLVGAYSQALVRAAERDRRIVVLDADLMVDTGLVSFAEQFPDRFVECGIAEQDMVSQAGGLALRGLLPVVHSFACFLSARPNEQIYNNATEKTKIVYVGSLAGLLPGGPGHSHQGVRDISALAAVPGLIMLEPSCERETELAVEFCLSGTPESCYLRLTSVPCSIPFRLPDGYRLQLGRGVTLVPGRDAAMIGYGPVLLGEATRAAGILADREGISLRVVNLPWLNRIDATWLAEVVTGVRWLFTLDNHYVIGGQGQFLAAMLAELDLPARPRIRRLGVDSVPVCGANHEVLRVHRLDADSLVEQVAAALRAR